MAGPPGPAAWAGPGGLATAFCVRFTHGNDPNLAVWADFLPPLGRDPFVFSFLSSYFVLISFCSLAPFGRLPKISRRSAGTLSFFVFSFYFIFIHFISFISAYFRFFAFQKRSELLGGLDSRAFQNEDDTTVLSSPIFPSPKAWKRPEDPPELV